jgi:hypothetical protein
MFQDKYHNIHVYICVKTVGADMSEVNSSPADRECEI